MKFLLILAVVCYAQAHPDAKVEVENSGVAPDGTPLYQGDMILSEEQLEELHSPPNERKALNNEQYRWPNGVVPFRIDTSSRNDRQAILAGMQHWMDNSCVTFQEVAANHQQPHLIFQKLGGCFSAVGRSHWQAGQVISIGQGCESKGTVAHEIAHALGMYHEQSRPDRDGFVVVLKQNLNQTMTHNFDLENNVNDFGITYDMSSVMHYGPDGFSINGRNTLVTKDPMEHFSIGQREGLSFADIKLGNIMYKCDARCGANKPYCGNGGFVDKNCRCVCPPGFSGNQCQSRAAVPQDNTRKYRITSPTTISSPNYPNNYPANSQVVWLAQAPAGRKVRASFTDFNTAGRWEGNNYCLWDYLEVRSWDLHDGEKYCGSDLNRRAITSQGNTMVLLFKSDSNYFKGFQAQIDFV